jgi:hypothetical protein
LFFLPFFETFVAIQLCLGMESLFTQEILAKGLHQMVESGGGKGSAGGTWPKLLLRTVLQALAIHSGLAPFVKNILAKLASREIWKHKMLWEGWIRALRATLPASLSLSLALPAEQVEDILNRVPGLRASLAEWIQTKGIFRQPRVAAVLPLVFGDSLPPEVMNSVKLPPKPKTNSQKDGAIISSPILGSESNMEVSTS